MISAFCQTYHCTFDYALNEIIYSNFILYGAVIPKYNEKKDDEIDADDPKNQQLISKMFNEE